MQKLPADAPEGSNAQKVGDYYRAFIDTAAIDQKGIGPAPRGDRCDLGGQESP